MGLSMYMPMMLEFLNKNLPIESNFKLMVIIIKEPYLPDVQKSFQLVDILV